MSYPYEEQPVLGWVGQPKADIYTPTATQKYRLGTRYHLPDGRSFYYSKANASSALVAGNLIQSAVNNAVATAQEDCTVATGSSIGDDFCYVTTKTDTITKDLYRDGWVGSGAGTLEGRGLCYQIKSNPAGAAGSIKFTIYDTVKVAIVAASNKAWLIMNPYMLVVQQPQSPSGFCVGGAIVPVTASYYFWLQTWGIFNMLCQTAVTAGLSIVVDAGAAGAGTIQTTTPLLTTVIGQSCQTIDTTDNGPVMLNIAW